MNVKKFVAASSREAWRNVRETLGPDAVILSNRTVEGGVEILAMANEEMSTLATPALATRPKRPPRPLAEPVEGSLEEYVHERERELRAKASAAASASSSPSASKPAPVPAAEARVWRNRGANSASQAVALADVMAARRLQAAATENAAAAYSEVMNEIRQMRGALESQLADDWLVIAASK